jgi:hypothetical protein
VLGAMLGLASRLRCSCGMPTLPTTIWTVPSGRPAVMALPIDESRAAASVTEMPGAKRT